MSEKKKQKKGQLEQLSDALTQVDEVVKKGQKIAKGIRSLIQEIKGNPNLKDIRIIMLTAKGQEADGERSSSCGADEFMSKPFSLAKIVERVKELLK